MEANKTLLHMKYAKIVIALAEKLQCSTEHALDLFYCSTTRQLIEEVVSDLHCRSDYYLADEIILEYHYKKEYQKGQLDRPTAYQDALTKLLNS